MVCHTVCERTDFFGEWSGTVVAPHWIHICRDSNGSADMISSSGVTRFGSGFHILIQSDTTCFNPYILNRISLRPVLSIPPPTPVFVVFPFNFLLSSPFPLHPTSPQPRLVSQVAPRSHLFHSTSNRYLRARAVLLTCHCFPILCLYTIASFHNTVLFASCKVTQRLLPHKYSLVPHRRLFHHITIPISSSCGLHLANNFRQPFSTLFTTSDGDGDGGDGDGGDSRKRTCRLFVCRHYE